MNDLNNKGFICDWCEYETFDKRYMGLHVNHNHPDKMNEFLRVYDDNIDETEYNKK